MSKLTDRDLIDPSAINGGILIHVVDPTDTTDDPDGSSYRTTLDTLPFFYSSDGVLSGDREVDLDGNSLVFGDSGISGGYQVSLKESDAAIVAFTVRNSNTGTSALTKYIVGNNIGGSAGSFGATSSTYSGLPQDAVFVAADGTRSLFLSTNGVVRQTISSTGATTFSGSVTATSFIGASLDVAATGGTDVLTIGGGNADIITIGRAGITVNILGSVLDWKATNSYVDDVLITLNRGGGAATALGSGIEFEENGSITGFFKTSDDRTSFKFKAPAVAYDAVFDFSGLVTSQRIYRFIDSTYFLTGWASLPSANTIAVMTGNGLIQNDVNFNYTSSVLHCPSYDGLVITSGSITTGAWNATPVGTTKGGTALTSYTTGDTIYASATNVLSKRSIGNEGDIYTVVSGVPNWTSSTALLSSFTEGSVIFKGTSALQEDNTNFFYDDTLNRLNLQALYIAPGSGITGQEINTTNSLGLLIVSGGNGCIDLQNNDAGAFGINISSAGRGIVVDSDNTAGDFSSAQIAGVFTQTAVLQENNTSACLAVQRVMNLNGFYATGPVLDVNDTTLEGTIAAKGPLARLRKNDSNGEMITTVFNKSITTTGSAATGIYSYVLATGESYIIKAEIIAERTGGVSGSTGDRSYWSVIFAVKNVAGTVTATALTAVFTSNAPTYGTPTASVSSQTLTLNITGAATTDITWSANIQLFKSAL
jgi:hypothetical protein